jgi:hypothetical protein
MGKWILGIAVASAISAWSQTPEVLAHISNVDARDFETVAGAKSLATGLLEPAGVRLRWDTRCKQCETIEIRIDTTAPSSVGKETLAYALPYAKGREKCIHIFRDRIYNPPWVRAEVVLAYVITHEIVHMLDQLDRHSDIGVMKARWDYRDFLAMQQNRLSLAREDVERIRDHFHRPGE